MKIKCLNSCPIYTFFTLFLKTKIQTHEKHFNFCLIVYFYFGDGC